MKRKVGVTWDASSLAHDTGGGHPECSERLIAIREELQSRELWTRMHSLETRDATREELERNHTTELVDKVFDAEGERQTYFDGDTVASAGTTKAALRAAGSAVDLARAVYRREIDMGISLMRPPGHHAEYERAMGFCYFNNIAVAARSLIADEGLERVMIIDWDVHHGNGTQHSFENDPNVLFLSLHQYPFYPGSGALKEVGTGEGEGFTVNIPMPIRMTNQDYLFCFEELVSSVAESYQPEMILVSAGYDAHLRDPLGGMMVTEHGFAAMTDSLCALSERLCGGRLAAFLEGGYNLEGLARSVASTIEVMLGDQVETEVKTEEASSIVHDLAKELSGYLANHGQKLP